MREQFVAAGEGCLKGGRCFVDGIPYVFSISNALVVI